MGPLERLGRFSSKKFGEIGDHVAFLGEAFCEFVALPFRPRRFRLGDCALAFERAAFDGLPVSTGVGFLLGVILAFQCAAALQMFAVEVYVSDMLAIALFRELGPIITAIILAGRTGSAFAAEIGTMKVDEELDALSTMGLPPVRFLVMPRVVAAVLAMPVLTIFAELAGLVGGAIVLFSMRIPTEVYWAHVKNISTVGMILFGLGKSMLFGAIVGLIGCSAGIRTKSTADGVGAAATSAVVGSIVAIALSDGIIAVILYVWGMMGI